MGLWSWFSVPGLDLDRCEDFFLGLVALMKPMALCIGLDGSMISWHIILSVFFLFLPLVSGQSVMLCLLLCVGLEISHSFYETFVYGFSVIWQVLRR